MNKGKPNVEPILVSILIPCYNSEEYVAESIQSAFNQTHEHIEVIVVDDGSTDESLVLLQQLKRTQYPELKILTHEDDGNHGVSATRRRALQQAKGEYIALLDADDALLPESVERRLAILVANADTILCHTDMRVIGDTSDAAYFEGTFSFLPTTPYYYHKQPEYLTRNGICCSSVLVKKKYLELAPFDGAQLYQHEDWLCWCLLAKKGKFIFAREPLTLYRVHESAATTAVRKSTLLTHYSKLEMKLSLTMKSESFPTSIYSLFSASRTLLALMLIYAKQSILPEQNIGKQPFYRGIQYLRRIKASVFRKGI